MRLQSLSLEHFRNYVRLERDWPMGPVLLCGANAQGKTSLLEAIYVLATAHSPLTHVDQHLINWGARQQGLDYARLRAEVVSSQGSHEIGITLAQTQTRNGATRLQKRLLLDRKPSPQRALSGQLNVVLFLPQDLDLVAGPPAGRRRYLDETLSQVDAAYAAALETYNETLRQRNILLRHLQEEGGDPAQLDPLDERLARSGVAVSQDRRRLIASLSRYAARFHHELSNRQEWLQLEYEPNFDPARPPATKAYQPDLPLEEPASPPNGISTEDLVAAFHARLRQRRREEIERGVTLTGPHRDEMRFVADRVDLGIFGSRGQQRTAVLALKMAQLEWMKEQTRETPVLLLDEVLAELDQGRRRLLLAQVEQVEQAFLTATDPEMFDARFREQATLFRVEGGMVEAARGSGVMATG